MTSLGDVRLEPCHSKSCQVLWVDDDRRAAAPASLSWWAQTGPEIPRARQSRASSRYSVRRAYSKKRAGWTIWHGKGVLVMG